MALARASAGWASMGQPVKPAQRGSMVSTATKHALVSMGDVAKDPWETAPVTVTSAGEE